MKNDEQIKQLIKEALGSLIDRLHQASHHIYMEIDPECNQQRILRFCEPYKSILVAAFNVAIDHRTDIIAVMQEAGELYNPEDIEAQRTKILQYQNILKWLHPISEPINLTRRPQRKSPGITTGISC